MHSGERWRLGHRPALDGLRGVAVLMVMAAHFGIYDVNSTSTGSAGVTVFFTLSGFLITSLLLEERAGSGRVRRGAFYARRARRLVPAMLACVLLAVVLELLTLGRIADGDVIAGSLTYTANFVMMDGHWGGPTFLGNMWSLGIEEQFYLLWPFVVLALARLPKSRALVVLLYASLVPVVLRALLWNGGHGKVRLWMGFDTRADALLIGCLLAFWLNGRVIGQPVSRWWAASGAVVLATTMPWHITIRLHESWTAIQMPLVAALATAALIYPSVTGRTPGVLGSPVLRYVGSRSYGWYLYHGPIHAALVDEGMHSMRSAWLIAFPLTFLVAEASYRWIEQPFRLRRSHRAEQPSCHDRSVDLRRDVVLEG